MKLYRKNPRQITDKQFTDLGGSLSRLGDLGGIVHDLNSDEIIGGNQRSRVFDINQCDIQLIEQYLEPDEQGTIGLGFVIWKGKKYAYRQVRWTPKQCEEANIRANAAGGGWDFGELANEWNLDDILEWGIDKHSLDLDLWAGEPKDDPGAQIDKAEELREKWGVESGQLWRLGEHRLICGDCTDRATVERVMGGEKADCAFTSPPYNQGGKGKRLAPFYGGEGDDRTKDEYREFLLTVLSVMAGICKEDASILWNVMYNAKSRDDYGKVVFSDINPFLVQETIVWHKGHGFNVSTKGILSRNSELIFLMSLGEKYQTNQGEYETWFNTWKIGTQGSQTEGHGAAFPVELPEKGISLFCMGDIVYEPFLGSGTTLIACERLNRKCRAVEISPGYVAVAIQRWVDLTQGTPELLE